MRQDFQGANLGQWASYPPAQDIGYEPSLTPAAGFGSPGGRALMRIIRPNRAGRQRFGFIKKIRFVAGKDSQLRFSYSVNSQAPASIEIGFAGIDGRLYTARVAANSNQWSQTDLPFRELSVPPDARIEAIYIVATINDADPDHTYRFLIDNLEISALRPAIFDVQLPETELIDPWPALLSARSYRPGETISVVARAAGSMSSVQGILTTQTGKQVSSARLYDDATHGDRTAGDGLWSNNQLYSWQDSDPTGIWLLTVRGTTNKGQTVTADVRLLVRPKNLSTHPGLFFDSNDRERLLARSRDPRLASLWAHLQATAKSTRESGDIARGGDVFELLDSNYLLPSLTGYFDVLNRARSRIAYNALDSYLTGNVEARKAAKRALLDVARWKRWEPPWFTAHGQFTYYPAGLLAGDVALGYDLLYSELSEAERALVRDALIEKSIIPTFREYVLDNRAMANTSNWIAHTVGGSLIAAASIANDVAETDGRFEIYVGGLLRKLEDHMSASYLADGSYGEGLSYHEFDAETLGPALVAVRRAFGADYWKQTHVIESLSYPLYVLAQPPGATPDMGDTHPPAGHGIAPIVYQSKDPAVRWYYSHFDRPSIAKFIFYDDSVAPVAPELPTSKIFREKGNAVFRSGWNGDDIVFLFRAGPNFNHHHADQGSFLLSAFGEVLLSEAGWSDYYKDPYYLTFFTQAIGHNTVLVGGDPESQSIADTPQFKALDSYPRITDSVTSDFVDVVSSELSPVYQGRLARYSRRIAFLKPSYLIVFDDLEGKGKPDQFDFLLHLPDRSRVKVDDLTAIYQGDKASVAVRSFPNVELALELKTGHIPYQVFSARTPAETPALPGYLDFRTVSSTTQMQYLTAIVPAKTESEARSLISQMTALSGEDWRGLRVERRAKTDLVLFSIGASANRISHDEWEADAATLTVTQSPEGLEMFAVEDSRSLRRGNQILMSSESPLSIGVRYLANEAQASINTAATNKLTLFVGKTPIRILLDNRELGVKEFNVNRNGPTISLAVPSGQHHLRIVFG